MASPESEILHVIAERLSAQGPIVAQVKEVAAAQSRGNELVAALAAMPELLIQVRALLMEIRDLLTPEPAANLGLAGGTVVDKPVSESAP